MFKKVLAVLFAVCLLVAAIPAAAGTTTLPTGCPWIYYDSVYDSYKIAAFNEAEGVPEGMCPAKQDIYGLRLYVTCDQTPAISLIINCESSSWDQHDDIAWTQEGDYYVTDFTKGGPFALFKEADSYAQICIGNWGATDVTVVKAEWLDADGNVLQSSVADGAADGAALPQTGVVSAAVFYGLGSLLIGGGVVASKKARKED